MNKKLAKTIIVALFALLALLGLTSCFPGGGDTHFTITFIADGKIIDTITITNEFTEITRPTAPQKEGHIFDDWYYDNNLWQKPFTQQSIADGIRSNIKLYAHYIVDPATLERKVFFRVDDVVKYTLELTEGDNIAYDIYNPTKKGYTFVGWDFNGNGIAEVDEVPGVVGEQDIYVDAVFGANDYKIYFLLAAGEDFAADTNLDFDSNGSYLSVTYDSAYAAALDAVVVEKTGKVFSHWQSDGSQYSATVKYNVDGDIELTAVWAEEGSTGLIYSYAAGEYSVIDYLGVLTYITIPMVYDDGINGEHPVTKISAVSSLTLRQIIIQNSVTAIYSNAFLNCFALETIVFGTNVATIGSTVFPANQDIDIYCMATAVPYGWASGWSCGNNVILHNAEYEGKNFDISNPSDVQQTYLFAPQNPQIANGGTYSAIPALGYDIQDKTLTLKSAWLSELDDGEYTIKVNRQLSLTFTISALYSLNVYDDYLTIFYDKASNDDATRTFYGETPTSLYGGGIVQSDYSLIDSTLTLHKEYLSSLKKGDYELLIKGVDGFSEVLILSVFDSEGAPYNVKLDCDINAPLYTILFDSDYNGLTTYSCSIDGDSFFTCQSGDTLTALDIAASHMLTIKCDANGKTSSYTLPAMSVATYYLSETFSWQGITYNKYIADQSEMDAYMAYLVYMGCTDALITDEPSKPYGYIEDVVYISDNLQSQSSDFISIAAESYSFPWSYQPSASYLGNIYTITITYHMPPKAQYSTGYNVHDTEDLHVLTDNRRLAAGTRASAYNDFAINSHTKTEIIDSVQELDSLPYGVKPQFVGGSTALDIYNAALAVCRTYISSDMSDYQKVTIISDWLAENITYDYDAIDILNLQDDVRATSSLTVARNLINTELTSKPYWSAILDPVKNQDTIEELKEAFENLAKGLKTFRLDGVFVDGLAVCDGIASAFKLMCLIEGIECIKVSGFAGESHAWNKVFIDGDWYIVDPTWARTHSGDPVSSIYLSHQYLLITDEAALGDDKSRKEYNRDDEHCIATLATGSYDYYDNFDIGAGYDLIADSQEELNAIFDYYINNGCNIAEFKYNMEGTNKYSKTVSSTIYSWQFTENKVYIIDITILGG